MRFALLLGIVLAFGCTEASSTDRSTLPPKCDDCTATQEPTRPRAAQRPKTPPPEPKTSATGRQAPETGLPQTPAEWEEHNRQHSRAKVVETHRRLTASTWSRPARFLEPLPPSMEGCARSIEGDEELIISEVSRSFTPGTPIDALKGKLITNYSISNEYSYPAERYRAHQSRIAACIQSNGRYSSQAQVEIWMGVKEVETELKFTFVTTQCVSGPCREGEKWEATGFLFDEGRKLKIGSAVYSRK